MKDFLNQPQTQLEWAIFYINNGIPIIPIHSIFNNKCSCKKDDCQNPGKHPITKNGLKDAALNSEQIEKWWSTHPDANIGGITGNSTKLYVLDVDKKNGGHESLQKLEGNFGKLPNTLKVYTGGGGLHYYFKFDSAILKNRTDILSGLDFRGEGGYIILPQSKHLSGIQYKWERIFNPHLLAEIPYWLQKTISYKNYLIISGARNSSLASIAGKLKSRGYDENQILNELKEINNHRCVPTLPEDEIKKISSSISKYQHNKKIADKASATDKIIEIAKDMELFHTPEGKGFATIRVKDHFETWPINSNHFKEILLKMYFEKINKTPSSQSLKDSITALEAISKFRGDEKLVFLRMANEEEKLHVDLCNKEWQQITIDKTGWEINNQSQIKFIRSSDMKPFPIPTKGGDFQTFFKNLNIKDSDKILVLSFIIKSYFPTTPNPILVVSGEHGSGKSTNSKIIRSFIDPSHSPLRAPPKDEKDALISALHSAVSTYDNLSGIKASMSDVFCRISTGGGIGTRRLFTDDEEHIIKVIRPIIVNGIDDLTCREDFLDRAIIIDSPNIRPENRIEESIFWKNFEFDFPKNIGFIFSIISKVLSGIEVVKIPSKPRMADFALIGCAIEKSLGFPEGYFMDCYKRNIDANSDMAIESNAIAKSILDFMEEKSRWSGTATELLNEIKKYFTEEFKNSYLSPKSPSSLSRNLKRSAPLLRSKNIDIEFNRREGERGDRMVRIRNLEKIPSVSPVKSGNLPPLNSLQCEKKISDLSDGTDTKNSNLMPSYPDNLFESSDDWEDVPSINHD